MVDIARLALEIDSRSATKAAKDLDSLSRASDKTEKQVTSFSQRSNAALASLGRTIGGVAAAFVSISAGRSLVQANLQIEKLTNTLTVGAGSARAAAEELKFLREQSQTLGLNFETTAEQFSKLAAAARGTAIEGEEARNIFLGIAKASTALGLSADEASGALTAIQQIISKGKVSAEELRGQLGERLPGAFQIAARSIGVTTSELDKMLSTGNLLAEDLLPSFARELNKTFGPQAEKAAQGLNAQLNRMETAFFDLKVAIGQTGIIDFFNDAIQGATKFLNTLTGAVSTTQKTAIERQIEFVQQLENEVKELQGKGSFLGFVKSGLVDTTRELHAAEQRLEDARDDLDRLTKAAEETEAALLPLPRPIREVVEQIENVGKSTKSASDGLDKMRNRVEQLTLQFSPLDRMNNELAELVQLRDQFGLRDDIFDAAATQAINRYADSLELVVDDFEELDIVTQDYRETGRRVFDDISQFAIQGARSMQQALSDALLEGIEGFKNFGDAALNIIKRLAANIASVKILEGLGVGGLLGVGSTSAFASGGGFGASNIFSGASNLISSGFGLSNLFGSFATSGIGQSLGLSVTGPVAEFGQLTTLGSSIGTSLATAGAGLLGFGIGNAIAGNNRVFGASGTVTAAIGAGIGAAVGGPIGAALGGVLGGGVNALFGRGPFKQKDSLIRGTVTEEGIGGDFLTATNFKAKGGLLRGDKVDRVIINANTGELVTGAPGLPESGISSKLLPFADQASQQALQIGELFNTTIQGFNQSLQQSADVLGLGTQSLNDFNQWVQITTDSAEGITQTQVAEALADIGNQMANALVPGIESFARGGETATQALARMVQETKSLENALVVLGVSSADAESAILGLSLAARTELVDAAGGLNLFNQQIAFFANNFLTAEQQLELSFNALDVEMQKLGFSANISREEFANLVQSVTQAGGISTEVTSGLLRLAPAFDQVKRAEEQVAAESAIASGSLIGLSGSISTVGAAATNTAATVQASFARIDTARANLRSAELDLAVAQSRSTLSDAQNELSIANSNLATARSNLAAAQSAEQQRQSAAQQGAADELNNLVSERNELINSYQSEAQALRSVVDRFGALSDRILDFKDSLALGNLSPFSPGEQLAIAKQQLETLQQQAAAGDEQAFNRIPSAVESFVKASKTFNGATDRFEQDFLFGQSVLDNTGALARNISNTAEQQLTGVEGTISELQALNDAAQDISRSVGGGFDQVVGSMLSVEEALAAVERATADVAAAQAKVDDATAAVNDAVRDNGGAINDVERATNAVELAVRELSAAVLQGFGNAFISDQQIRDFVIANQNLTDQQFAQIAVQNGVSGSQLARALQPLGVTQERINVATGGLSVRDDQISAEVDRLLGLGDFFGIYNAARANGISSDRLAAASVLSKQEIDNFVRANNLQPFERGTDLITKTGPILAHKGEGITPSSVPGEIKKLREELAELRREQNQQMSALINTNIQANKENAQAIAKSNEKLAASANWRERSKARVA